MRKGSVISRIHIFFNWVAEESDLPLEEMTEEELYDIFIEFNEDLQGIDKLSFYLSKYWIYRRSY